MAKTEMLCPFTNELCDECAIYRGRHYYLSFCKQYRGYIGESKKNAISGGLQHSLDFQALKKAVEPWSGAHGHLKTDPKIRLKVIDIESGATRVCDLAETKTWDWSNPQIMRIIDGAQVTTRDKLVEILRYRAEKGYQEVDLYEGPRFMLLGGG